MSIELKLIILIAFTIIVIVQMYRIESAYIYVIHKIRQLRILKTEYGVIRVYVGGRFLCIVTKYNYRQIAKWMAKETFRGCVGKDGHYQIFFKGGKS